MGNSFKVSSSFPKSISSSLETSKLKLIIEDAKQDGHVDIDASGLEKMLNLNREDSELAILRFSRNRDKPIVSKYHLLSGLTVVSQGGSVNAKIQAIFNLFDMSGVQKYSHDEFGVCIFATLASVANLCDLLLNTKKIQTHIDELKGNDEININTFQKWCLKELDRESEIFRRASNEMETLPLPVPTDPPNQFQIPKHRNFSQNYHQSYHQILIWRKCVF